MMRHVRRIALIALAIACIPLAGHAQGEEFQPSGITLGNFILKPSLRLAAGYDSNANFNADGSLGEEVDKTGTTTVTLGAGWSVPYIRAVDFNGSFGVGWTQKFLGEGNANDASGVGIGGSLKLQINPRGGASFYLEDRLRLNNDSQYTEENILDPYGVTFDENGVDFGSERVLMNGLQAGVAFHPGGDVGDERMGISGRLGGFHNYRHYIERDNLDRHTVGGQLRLNWNFLPRTAATFRASVARTMYTEEVGTYLTQSGTAVTITDRSSPLARNDSTSARFSLGLRGMLTERLSIATRVGYGLAWYEAGANPGQVIAVLQLTGHFNRGHKLRGSYSTNFGDASFGNYIKYHRFVLAYELNRGRVGWETSIFGQINEYSPYANASSFENYSASRTDYPIGINSKLRFAITDNVQIGVQYRFDANFSDFQAVQTSSTEPVGAGDVSFLKHRTLLFLRFAI